RLVGGVILIADGEGTAAAGTDRQRAGDCGEIPADRLGNDDRRNVEGVGLGAVHAIRSAGGSAVDVVSAAADPAAVEHDRGHAGIIDEVNIRKVGNNLIVIDGIGAGGRQLIVKRQRIRAPASVKE